MQRGERIHAMSDFALDIPCLIVPCIQGIPWFLISEFKVNVTG